jgi:hypothetical protein
MTFREVKVAEFEHFPVFFPDNREFGKKCFRGRPDMGLALGPINNVATTHALLAWLHGTKPKLQNELR